MERGDGERQTGPGWRHISQAELILQTEMTVAAAKQYTSYLCPCQKCHGGRMYSTQSIIAHFRQYGRDIHLDHSMVGGDPPEGYPV